MRFLCALILSSVALQAQPDLTGAWIVDGGPMGIVRLRIASKDNQLQQTMLMGDRIMRMTYLTNGEESSTTMHGMPYKSRLRWEGTTMVIDSVMGSPDRHWLLKDRWTLSEDGQTLTWVTSSSGPGSTGKPETRIWRREPGEKAAAGVYRNLELLKDLTVSDVNRLMESWNRALGVACTHCHVQDEWADESVKAKQATRDMLRMVGSLGSTVQVSCWTCHRGAVRTFTPAGRPPSDQWPNDTVSLTAEQANLPAAQAFRNVRVMGQVPAARLAFAMNFFRASLGVECSHCHVPGQWEKDDKPAKATARRMIVMVQNTLQEFRTPLFCYTCHRGARRPEN
jgi:hypothetical protein